MEAAPLTLSPGREGDDDLRAKALLDQINAVDARIGDAAFDRNARHWSRASLLLSGIVAWLVLPDYRWMVPLYLVVAVWLGHFLRERRQGDLTRERDRLLAQHAEINARLPGGPPEESR